MKCRECGTENPENANFCENCGKKLLQSPKSSKKSQSKLLIAILCIVAILGIIGLYVATHSNVIASEGMEPVMYRGDIILVDQNPSSVQVGDIVIYNATWYPMPVVHRIIEIRKMPNGDIYLIMKGDNNQAADPVPVKYPDQMISKVVSINGQPVVIPKLGYPFLWIRGL